MYNVKNWKKKSIKKIVISENNVKNYNNKCLIFRLVPDSIVSDMVQIIKANQTN